MRIRIIPLPVGQSASVDSASPSRSPPRPGAAISTQAEGPALDPRSGPPGSGRRTARAWSRERHGRAVSRAGEEQEVRPHDRDPVERRRDHHGQADPGIRLDRPVHQQFAADEAERAGEADARQAGQQEADGQGRGMLVQPVVSVSDSRPKRASSARSVSPNPPSDRMTEDQSASDPVRLMGCGAPARPGPATRG